MATATIVSRPLPPLPAGWAAERDFKPLGAITASTQRTIEPVGPHFLAHARRARHKRTFSEDDRIQAQERAQKIEKEDESEESEAEDPMMLQREAKDWKVRRLPAHVNRCPSNQLYDSHKITIRSSACPSTAGRPPRTRSSVPIARRF